MTETQDKPKKGRAPLFGWIVKRRREARGLTLADVAEYVGCTITEINDYERGVRMPPRPNAHGGPSARLTALADALDVNADWLTLVAEMERAPRGYMCIRRDDAKELARALHFRLSTREWPDQRQYDHLRQVAMALEGEGGW